MLLVFRSCSTHGNRVSESLAQIGVSLMGEILERLLVGGKFEKDFSPCYICTVHDGVMTHASECTSTQKSEIRKCQFCDRIKAKRSFYGNNYLSQIIEPNTLTSPDSSYYTGVGIPNIDAQF